MKIINELETEVNRYRTIFNKQFCADSAVSLKDVESFNFYVSLLRNPASANRFLWMSGIIYFILQILFLMISAHVF